MNIFDRVRFRLQVMRICLSPRTSYEAIMYKLGLAMNSIDDSGRLRKCTRDILLLRGRTPKELVPSEKILKRHVDKLAAALPGYTGHPKHLIQATMNNVARECKKVTCAA